MSDADWQRLYHLYQQIPQYALVNEGFGLAGFKQIFWLEWIHRLWGRLIGVVFLAPLVWFWATGRIERRLRPKLVLLFVLGGSRGRSAGSWWHRGSFLSPLLCLLTGWCSTLLLPWSFTVRWFGLA